VNTRQQKIKSAVLYAAGIVTGIALTMAVGLTGMAGATPTPAAPRPFADVPSGYWAAHAVAELKKDGIVEGEPGPTYSGNQYVTRYEAAVLIDRFVHFIEKGQAPLHATQVDPKDMPPIPPGYAHDATVDLLTSKFAGPDSPLLIKPGNAPLTATQMGESLSTAVNRLSDRAVPPTPNSATEN
jgi:hypothetical protein